jgi:hypothetical protein
MRSGTVAVVVPLSLSTKLSGDDETSLRHLVHYLGPYDKYFLAAKGTRFTRPGFELMPLPARYFGSARAHTRLQLSEDLYTRFRGYKYILMHHLDALVLSDQLPAWCETDLDFVGPPWLPCEDSPWVTRARVGNSGFALMKVESFLNVIRSKRPSVDPDEYWKQFCLGLTRRQRILNWPRKYLKRLRMFNGVKWETRRLPSGPAGLDACDYFWSDRAVTYWPDFKIASVDQGVAFAFEVAPRLCFEMNHRRLPFGSHAWARYDRLFWEPHLLR